MKWISLFLILTFSMTLYSCHQQKKEVQNSAAKELKAMQEIKTVTADTVKKIHIAISQLASSKDPICGMPLSEKTLEDTAMIDGKIYGYCNTGCKEEHLKQIAANKK